MQSKTFGCGMLSMLIFGACVTLPAFAQRPGEPDGGPRHEQPRDHGNDQRQRGPQGDRHASPQAQRHDSREHPGAGSRRPPHQAVDVRFEDRQRTLAHDYFQRETARGRCPPGLVRRGKGCEPPAAGRRWAVGRPLPREVIFYDLPPALVVDLGTPPAGYRYVRVASDILMIAVGTGLVVDAIQDLVR